MKLSPPKQITWFIALALAVLALLGSTGTMPHYPNIHSGWPCWLQRSCF